jgi:hypothetical protein
MGAKITYDTTSTPKLIRINTGITEIDVQVDIYSDGKEDWLARLDLAKYEFPLSTVGGESLTTTQAISPKFFLASGWAIKPHEADHELLIAGDLYSAVSPPEPLAVATSGNHTVTIIFNRSFDSITTVVETSGSIIQQGDEGLTASFI